MSHAGNTPPTAVDENVVEAGVREVLAPLDRTIERLEAATGILFLVIGAGAFYVLGWRFDFVWWSALLWGFGAGFVAMMPLIVFQENIVVAGARRRFESRFPEGSPARPVALRILSEMESPSKAEQKLRDALQAATPAERIVRRRRESPEGQVNAALNQLGGAPAALPPVPHNPAPPSAPAPPRTPGAFDYMPLKPREGPAPGDPPS